MNREQFNRFNLLSERVMQQTASTLEIEELNEFLKGWNQSVESSVINRVHLRKIAKVHPYEKR